MPASVRARYDSWSASARLVQPLGDNLELQLRGLAYEDDRVLRFVPDFDTPQAALRYASRAAIAWLRGDAPPHA